MAELLHLLREHIQNLVRAAQTALVLGLWGCGVSASDMLIASILLAAGLAIGLLSIALLSQHARRVRVTLGLCLSLFFAVSEVGLYWRHQSALPQPVASGSVQPVDLNYSLTFRCDYDDLTAPMTFQADHPVHVLQVRGPNFYYPDVDYTVATDFLLEERGVRVYKPNSVGDSYKCVFRNRSNVTIMRASEQLKFTWLHRKLLGGGLKATVLGSRKEEASKTIMSPDMSAAPNEFDYFYIINLSGSVVEIDLPRELTLTRSGSDGSEIATLSKTDAPPIFMEPLDSLVRDRPAEPPPSPAPQLRPEKK